ncbi:MAG: DUF2029 domain-containing protein [Anaerolineales bacterium]|nr:DUF2029 domain-containing protein [Anaerolineales bacterium]
MAGFAFGKITRNAFKVWLGITALIGFQCLWIVTRNGLDGFQAYVQDSPLTYTPLALASAGCVWLLAGLALGLLYKNKITHSNLYAWAGFFIVAVTYLNVLRERIRYGDIGYYIEAAFKLYQHQPLPDTYIYPPFWATLLSLLTPLGEDGMLIVCWLANLLSLFAFYYLLCRTLERYQFKAESAAIVTTVFMLVNMPLLRTLLYVQVNLHVLNLIFLSLLLYKNKPFLSALALALAVHLKASPMILVLAFLLELNWKWLAYLCLNLIFVALFTVALYGFDPYLQFIHNAALLAAPREFSLRDSSFDSFFNVSLAYLRMNAKLVQAFVYLAKFSVTGFAIFISLTTAGLYAKAENAKLYNALPALLFAMVIASPLIWEHHGVFLALPFLLLLKKLEQPKEWLWFGAAYLFIFLMPTFDFFPWSYVKLFGILILPGLLWIVKGRKDNSFFLDGQPHGAE